VSLCTPQVEKLESVTTEKGDTTSSQNKTYPDLKRPLSESAIPPTGEDCKFPFRDVTVIACTRTVDRPIRIVKRRGRLNRAQRDLLSAMLESRATARIMSL